MSLTHPPDPPTAPATGLLGPPGTAGEPVGRLGAATSGGLAAAVRAFCRAIDPTGPLGAPPVSRRSRAVASTAEGAYRVARRAQGRHLLAWHPEAERQRLPLAPRLMVDADAWTLEGWDALRSTFARLVVDRGAGADETDLAQGTTRVGLAGLGPWLAVGPDPAPALDLVAGPIPPDAGPPGGLRGLDALMGALTLPARRVPMDRGGLLALLGGLRRSATGRSVVVRWESDRPAWVEVAGRSAALHARAAVDGPAGSARVPVGRALAGLGDLLPGVEGAEILLGPAGVVGTWVVRLAGGIRLVLALPAWTLDGRWGALRVDALAPPVEAGGFLLNQVVASFRDRPSQTRREVVERTRGNPPAVLAALYRLATLGLILPEPEADRLRWRPGLGSGLGPDPIAVAGVPDDPEPAEVAAARAITRTASIQVTRDEPLPNARGRRVEATILDRPARLELDPDGWLRRGACTCSHHEAGRLVRGPCRHLLALQARVVDGVGLAPPPTDLAGWFAALGGVL